MRRKAAPRPSRGSGWNWRCRSCCRLVSGLVWVTRGGFRADKKPLHGFSRRLWSGPSQKRHGEVRGGAPISKHPGRKLTRFSRNGWICGGQIGCQPRRCGDCIPLADGGTDLSGNGGPWQARKRAARAPFRRAPLLPPASPRTPCPSAFRRPVGRNFLFTSLHSFSLSFLQSQPLSDSAQPLSITIIPARPPASDKPAGTSNLEQFSERASLRKTQENKLLQLPVSAKTTPKRERQTMSQNSDFFVFVTK